MEFKEYSKVKMIIISKHNKLNDIANPDNSFKYQSHCSSESKVKFIGETCKSDIHVCENTQKSTIRKSASEANSEAESKQGEIKSTKTPIP